MVSKKENSAFKPALLYLEIDFVCLYLKPPIV